MNGKGSLLQNYNGAMLQMPSSLRTSPFLSGILFSEIQGVFFFLSVVICYKEHNNSKPFFLGNILFLKENSQIST